MSESNVVRGIGSVSPCEGCPSSCLAGNKCPEWADCSDWEKWNEENKVLGRNSIKNKMSGHLFEMHAHSV